MKISVITIVYNDIANIEGTLLSVIKQSAFDHIEYIVVDGASSDGTSEVIQKYANQIDKYICEPDSGIYNAMNKGLEAADGDYVQFINSGDAYSASDVIEKIINDIGDDNPDVVYGHYRESQGKEVKGPIIPCRSADKIWYGPVASHQSMIYSIQHLRTHRIIYDETYKIAADYKFSAQSIKSADSILKTDICISDFDISGVSSTNQNHGLKEANRVRKEVFGWNVFKIISLSAVLLCARYAKKYLKPIYKLIRY